MKCRYIDNNCTTLQDDAAVIDRYESIIGEAASKTTRSNVRSIDTTGVDTNISNLLQKLDSRFERLEHAAAAQPVETRQTSLPRPTRHCYT